MLAIEMGWPPCGVLVEARRWTASQDVRLKFFGKSSFVDLALVVGSTKFQGDGEEMELGPNKWPGSPWWPCKLPV